MDRLIQHENFPRYLLYFVLSLFIIRFPSLFYDPRFYAEEGVIYYKYALEHDWLNALFTPHLGYFSLINNLSAVLSANLVPMEYSPFITTFIALLVQAIPFVIVIFGSSPYWKSPQQKLLTSLIILFVGNTAEIWMTTLSSQFHLSLVTFLLLLESSKKAGRLKQLFYCKALAIAGLTGVLSCFLTPLFVLKALKERKRIYVIQSAILIISLAIQLTVFIHSNDHLSLRSAEFNPDRFVANVFSYNIAGVVVGWWSATNISEIIIENKNIFITSLLATFFVLILSYFSLALKRWDKLVFISSFLLLSILSTLLSIKGEGGARYAYTPSVIFTLMIYQSIPLKNIRAKISKIIVTWSLIVGAILFLGLYLIPDPGWPSWHEEVTKWRKNNEHKLTVHPPHWSFYYTGE